MPSDPIRTAAALLALLGVCLAAGIASHPAAAARRSRGGPRAAKVRALRERLQALKAKKAVKQAQLRQTKRAQRRLSDQLNQSYQKLESAKGALKASEQRLHLAEKAVRAATERLRAAEIRLALQRRRFGKRIASSYMEGPVSYTDVLLGSRNISDLLDRQYYVSRITSRDAELLKELRRAQQEVADERRGLVVRREALAQAHEENAARVADVASEAAQREGLLHEIEHERALQEQRLEELDEDSVGIQHSLEQELARRAARPGSFRNLPRWSGSLYRPARGPIVSRFGYRYHPVLHYSRLHAGVDIGAGEGSGVYAAASGEVFYASWRGGYGQCIIVLHGGGMSTLYGHLSRISVRSGQTIKRGQLIGAVGSTGLATGPHLHFEVRRNGVPVNPM
jgi:murein DD-endopeptidase MepM/ murein hydrolase activator NlpD